MWFSSVATTLGYGDPNCYGSNIQTPKINGMAGEGVRFEPFYSTSSVCSPSRASLMTGRYATRVGVPDVLPVDATTGLSLSETTIAEMQNRAGYESMAVGKWHLGVSAVPSDRPRFRRVLRIPSATTCRLRC